MHSGLVARCGEGVRPLGSGGGIARLLLRAYQCLSEFAIAVLIVVLVHQEVS